MKSISSLNKAFHKHIKQLFSLDESQIQSISLEINEDAKKQQFGDFSTNAALIIAKIVKDNPRTVAEKIRADFSHETLDRLEIAGPGFINMYLSEEAFKKTAKLLFCNHTDYFKLDEDDKKINFNIEYVSGNPTGPLHLGHGRNGIIGDVLANICKFLGHTVTKEFYINDAGAQIQKLGNSFKIRCQQALGHDVKLPEDAYHGDYLVTMAQDLIAQNKQTVENELSLESSTFFADYAKDFLRAQQEETLKQYGITFDVWFSEKVLHVDNAIEKALDFLEKNNYAYMHEDALWLKSTAFGDDKDRVLKRSNGEITYLAADVAYLQNKLNRGTEKALIVLGQDHHGYVKRMKALMQALGHKAEDLEMILYQLVTLKEDGELIRMSKRTGRIISLRDVIQEVGKDVARFFYLNRKAEAHLEFDMSLALKRTEENPVYYIQYAYVRTKSMLEKADQHQELTDITENDFESFTDQEKLLFKKIMNLKSLLKNISHNYHTHLLTYYVLDLAHNFHSYYGSHKVIDVNQIKQSRSRLAIIKVLKKTFELCMELLGIDCPESM